MADPRRSLAEVSIPSAANRVAGLAAAWGSRLVDVGAVGHLNPAAGYGEWPRAEEFIHQRS